MPLWHKKFADMLNIVVIVKTNVTTQSMAQVVLCSSDLSLSYDLLIDYDRLRLQWECNFRDAKQYWGLEDFMTVKQTPVYNRANLAMFMVHLSHTVMRSMRGDWPEVSVTKSAEKPRRSRRGWIGVGRAGLNAQEPNKTHAVPEPSMGEGPAEVEAPAFMPGRTSRSCFAACPASGKAVIASSCVGWSSCKP